MKALLVAAATLVLFAPCRASVSDSVVQQWIAASLTRPDATLPASSAATLAIDRDAAALRTAWSRLKSCRDSGQAADLNLAAAEHYLFARFIACTDGDTNYLSAPKWYETLKTIASRAALESLLKTSNQPTSPVSAEVTRWGTRGIEHGLVDYERQTKAKPSAKTANALLAIGFVYTLYETKYVPQQSDGCDVIIAPVGTWISIEPDHRWKLVISEGAIAWTEQRGAATLTRTVPILTKRGKEIVLQIERPNDAEVLGFLGMSPAMTTAILARSPRPSYLRLLPKNDGIDAEFFGIIATKDASDKFNGLKQPGETPGKPSHLQKN